MSQEDVVVEDEVANSPGGAGDADRDRGRSQGRDQTRVQARDRVQRREPSWWHRDHPTFTALSGFYTGLIMVIVVPGVFGALLAWMFDQQTAERLFPLVLLALVVPIGLLAWPRTRRFAIYLWIGLASTLLVVVTVAALVVWVMVKQSG